MFFSSIYQSRNSSINSINFATIIIEYKLIRLTSLIKVSFFNNLIHSINIKLFLNQISFEYMFVIKLVV